MLFDPISTSLHEVYDIRQGYRAFSFKRESPNLEMIGSLHLTPHGFLPLVYVRGAGVPALGANGRPFVYRLRHIDPTKKEDFNSDFASALKHLTHLMALRALDIPYRQDAPQIKAVQDLIEWTKTLPERIPTILATNPSGNLPLSLPLQTYQTQTYEIAAGETVLVAQWPLCYCEARIIETPHGFLPATRISPSADGLLVSPYATSAYASAILSSTSTPLSPTPFYASAGDAASVAAQDLQRAARRVVCSLDATPEEADIAQSVRDWSVALAPVVIAEEFVSRRPALIEPSLL